MLKRLLILACEINGAESDDEAMDLLDQFREEVRPGMNYGITLYRATSDDIARCRVMVGGSLTSVDAGDDE